MSDIQRAQGLCSIPCYSPPGKITCWASIRLRVCLQAFTMLPCSVHVSGTEMSSNTLWPGLRSYIPLPRRRGAVSAGSLLLPAAHTNTCSFVSSTFPEGPLLRDEQPRQTGMRSGSTSKLGSPALGRVRYFPFPFPVRSRPAPPTILGR